MRLSRSLLKLIDEAIIPALLVFGAKLVGLVMANTYYNLSWDTQGLFPLISYRSSEAYAMANGFSNVVVFVVILTGFLTVLVRAHAFHATHISPRLSVSLVRMEMTGIVANSWEIYHQAVIWLALLWLSLIWFALQAMAETSPWWLVIGGTAIAAMFSWLFVVDVEREMELGEEQRHAA